MTGTRSLVGSSVASGRSGRAGACSARVGPRPQGEHPDAIAAVAAGAAAGRAVEVVGIVGAAGDGVVGLDPAAVGRAIVLPRRIVLGSRIRATMVASRAGTMLARSGAPIVIATARCLEVVLDRGRDAVEWVGWPRGARRPSRARASARSSSTWTTAFTRGFDLVDAAQVRLHDLEGGRLAVADGVGQLGAPASAGTVPRDALRPRAARVRRAAPGHGPRAGPRTPPGVGKSSTPRPADSDDIIESFPVFLVSDLLAARLSQLPGVTFREAMVRPGDTFLELFAGALHKAYARLHVGAGPDFCLDDALQLNVSDQAIEILRQFNLRRCDIQRSRSG